MRMYMKFLLSLLLAVCAHPLAAKELGTVGPESVGLSSERLVRIGAVMKGHIDAGRFPGAVALHDSEHERFDDTYPIQSARLPGDH